MTRMRTLHVGCEFDYDVAVDTPAVVIVQPSTPTATGASG
jgi:hypothetical protein